MTDIVPERIRGRYFGSRNMAVGLAGLLCAPLAGYLIKATGAAGYRVSFLISAATGFAATAVFAFIKEPKKARLCEKTRKPALGLVSIFKEHPQFAAFTAIGFILHLSLQVSGPFNAVYQIQVLGANTAHIGILGSIGALTGMIGQKIWGAQNDRKSDVWVLRVTHFLIPGTSLAWALTPDWSYLPQRWRQSAGSPGPATSLQFQPPPPHGARRAPLALRGRLPVGMAVASSWGRC